MSQQQLINELKNIKHDSVFADVIRQHPCESIEMIKAQALDNRVVVCDIVGEHLVKVIEQL